MRTPTVMLLIGPPGTGKTTLIHQFSEQMAGKLQVLTPSNRNQALDSSGADFQLHEAIAVDEISSWEQESLSEAIASLEAKAKSSNKKLVLVLQFRDDLEKAGVVLSEVPAVMEISGPMSSGRFSYAGSVIQFPEFA